jgi:hypothetical protein
MATAQNSCDKWIWTELVGFDNTSADLGVGSYLDNLGFQPEAICLFVSAADFILKHPSVGKDGVLPIDCCTYAAHSFNEDRKCQSWTQLQVRDLITELHKHGVGAYVSVMTWYTHNRFHDEWVEDHKEVLAWENVGPDVANNINPLKRFKDGSYFEDFFLKQLLDVIHYYGFDGWHAADGWGCAMNNIYDADFSDDMVDQFTKACKITLPEEYSGQYAGPEHDDRDKNKARADWIWRNLRMEWIEFWVERWYSYFKKIATALHSAQKKIMVNSSLTRDPFEAIYRFGIDYKRLVEAGVDGFVVETGAAAQDLVSGDRNRHYDYTSTFMLIRAYVPDTKLIFLNVIQDHCENFDGLRHMPTAIEKEVLALSNLHYYDTKGKLQHSANGMLVCLGDSIEKHEWQWLNDLWELGFSGDTKSTNGPTLVWSDSAIRKQLVDFNATRKWHTQKILHNLTERGAPVQTTVNVNDVDKTSGPLLLINPDTFTKEELRKVFKIINRPVVVIGGASDTLPEPDFYFEDIVESFALCCSVYGVEDLPEITLTGSEEDQLQTDDVMGIVEAHFFINELATRTVSDKFLNACVEVILSASGSVKITEGQEFIKLLAMKQQDGSYRLLLKSDSLYYSKASVNMGKQVVSAKSATRYPFAPITVEDTILKGIAVPNKGAVILNVRLAD